MKNNIDTLRQNAGLTVQKLADAAGISRVYLSDLKEGKKPLNERVLTKLAKALKFEPYEILSAGFDKGDRCAKVPIYGEVPGGDWREAIHQHPDRFVFFPTNKKGLFGLIVVGTSVNRAVPAGGVAIINPAVTDPRALANRLVVVLINRHGVWEATCKVYKQNPDRFEPFSTEPHDTIFPGGDEWVICGSVIGSIAHLDEENQIIDVRNRGQYLEALEAA